MPTSDIEVFLASRFNEFRAVRARLSDLFAAGRLRGDNLRLLDYNSDAAGKPPILEFCLHEAHEAKVFVLLVGKTYPRQGTGPDGVSISHAEYLEALKSGKAAQIFVFLVHESFRDFGAGAVVRSRGLRQLLATIQREGNRPGHVTTVLSDGSAAEIADRIYRDVSRALRSYSESLQRSTVSLSAYQRLKRVLMNAAAGDHMELGPAFERLHGANQAAREAFRGRMVPDEPFARVLYRLDDSGRRKIRDFDDRITARVPGSVVGLVSPSGQGKSTFICDFPRRFVLAPYQYMCLTGRELTYRGVDDMVLSVAQVAKCMAQRPAPKLGCTPPPHFFLLVDALNECSRADGLLLHLVVWIEALVSCAEASGWPITVLLTMRPDVAKEVPALSRTLVQSGNTYDLEAFGEKEFALCAARHALRTPWDALRLSTQKLLGDPFMLAITGQEYAGCEVPPHNTDLKLLGRYLERLTRAVDGEGRDNRVLDDAENFAGVMLSRNAQTLATDDLASVLDGSALSALLASGILTDAPEGAHAHASGHSYGFRFDRVAELLIGRHVQRRLRAMQGGAPTAEAHERVAIHALAPTIAGLSELHWTGLALGLLFDLQRAPIHAHTTLIPLMKSDDAAWRMLARTVLLRMQIDDWAVAQPMFASVVRELVAYADRYRADKGFRAELMRAAYELVREHEDAEQSGGSQALEPLLLTLCVGLNSKDQEIADLAITSLSSLIARPRLVPAIERHVLGEILRMDLSLVSIIGKQAGGRLKSWWEFRGDQEGRRPLVVPVNTFVKLLIVCFATSLDDSGHAACVLLLAEMLRRFRKTVLGRTVHSAFGRSCMLFLLGTMLDIVLRGNIMPINAKEWKRLLKDPDQFASFKSAMRMGDPAQDAIDETDVATRFRDRAPNPFVYQAIVTALSTKYELYPASREAVLRTVRSLVAFDRGDGVAKYVASLVLYHVNTFGTQGTEETASTMIKLALDMLRQHDGLVQGERQAYNSNIIGTTGRSLQNLVDRGVLPGEGAFDFIRSQIDKVGLDRRGDFTKYLIDNLALLGVLLPENVPLLKLLKDEVYETKAKAPEAAADGRMFEWLVDAFVRVRAAHPTTVDHFLLRRDDSQLYHEVRERHAKAILQGDALGLDGEIVSWSFERIAFDILTKAPTLASRANRRWCDGMERSPRLRPSTLVDLGLIFFEESVAWAESHCDASRPYAATISASTP